MDAATLTGIIAGASLVGGAAGWLGQQYWQRRSARRQAAQDAGDTLKAKKAHLEEMLSEAAGTDREQHLRAQLDDVNYALLGLHSQRLRRAIKDAGLPEEDMLVANGRRQLAPHVAARIEQAAAEVSALPPPLPVQLMYSLGGSYYYAGRYEDAKGVFDRILRMTPDDLVALNNRGVTYAHMGRYDEALADYNRSLELRPDHADTLTNRGVTYDHMGRYDEALADFNRSLELRPDDADTLNNRGVTYGHMGRYEEALADFNRSLALRPDDADTLMNRGVAYSHVGKYEEALADYNRSLELRPDHADTLMNRGVAYSHMGRYQEALADFSRSLELRPDHASTLYNLACLFSLWAKKDDALANLEKAIAADEKNRQMARTDTDLDNIRDDPRFKKLVQTE